MRSATMVRLAGLMLLASLVGCGGPQGATSTTASTGTTSGTTSQADGESLAGTIKIDGSSSVFPVTSAVAEEFSSKHPDVKITVGQSGTGGGFKKFANGEIDINDASRPIKPAEKEASEKNGIEPVTFEVGTDALTVIVNKENTFCRCLSVEQLKKLWEPGSQVKSWKDLGEGFPDEEVALYGADNESGTFDFFTEVICGKSKASRTDYTASARDNQLIEGVAGGKNALGYVPYSYYLENKERVKAIGIKAEGSKDCVLPSLKSVDAGQYKPLARPLFICVSKKALARPEVKAFVKFYLTEGQKYVREITELNTDAEQLKKGLELLDAK